MIGLTDRCHAVELIDAAVTAGARQHKACEILEISSRTYQRWTQDAAVLADRRPDAQRPVPANKLGPEEREAILAASDYLEKATSLTRSRIFVLLTAAPVQGRYGGVMDLPNASASISIPTAIFDVDIRPQAAIAEKTGYGYPGVEMTMN